MIEQNSPIELQLRDIHLPDPISWWPLAPGWWIVLVAVILVIAFTLIIRKIYQSRQLLREISTELSRIKQQFQDSQNKSQLAKSLSVLLRRTSITLNPDADIAGLTGEHWLNWLDSTLSNPSKQKSFHSETGMILIQAPYLPEDKTPDFDADELIRLCESWLMNAKKNKGIAEGIPVT